VISENPYRIWDHDVRKCVFTFNIKFGTNTINSSGTNKILTIPDIGTANAEFVMTRTSSGRTIVGTTTHNGDLQ